MSFRFNNRGTRRVPVTGADRLVHRVRQRPTVEVKELPRLRYRIGRCLPGRDGFRQIQPQECPGVVKADILNHGAGQGLAIGN